GGIGAGDLAYDIEAGRITREANADLGFELHRNPLLENPVDASVMLGLDRHHRHCDRRLRATVRAVRCEDRASTAVAAPGRQLSERALTSEKLGQAELRALATAAPRSPSAT